MSSAFHIFAGPIMISEPPDRCRRLMPDGSVCGRPRGSHRKDVRKRSWAGRKDARRRKGDRHKQRRPKAEQAFVFFDTEGKGAKRRHRLVYGAAVDEAGQLVLEVEPRRGSGGRISSAEWLDALLEVGRRSKQRSCFAYGFGYDRTMMLADLPAKALYELTRRDERDLWCSACRSVVDKKHDCGAKRKPSPKPLYWGDYIIDLQGTRFSVSKLLRNPDGSPRKSAKTGKRVYARMTVWDVLKFFQAPFVEALDAWRRKTATTRRKPENLESGLVVPNKALSLMRRMKSKRAEFDKMPWGEVKAYCRGECLYGARLVRELVTACGRIPDPTGGNKPGVKLRRFDGAGSISDALMQKFEVGQYMTAKNVSPLLLDSVTARRFWHAVMCAFAGGRFEAAYCGIQRGRVFAKDIASAYPYAQFLLPCLACGTWEHLRGPNLDRQIDRADLALVHVKTLGRGAQQALGSLHNRDADGNITFPICNTTWTWKPEYVAARDLMRDRCKVNQAYMYRTDCDHRPFSFMGSLFLERLRIGKEGRGTAVKLGCNGCTGKTMQKVGGHRWQDYVAAGNTTSRTRAQLLAGIAQFRDQWEVAYLATDSIFALRDVPFPEPEDTGTASAVAHGKVPLGAWEPGKAPYDGMVFVRPGIAFPLNATKEQLKEIKARGISKSVLLENVGPIVDLMSSQRELVGEGGELEFRRRIFGGMKMCTSKRGVGAMATYHRGETYGTWYEQEISVRLAAQPKRLARLPGEDGMLLPWQEKPESLAYGSTRVSEEARALQELQDELSEQPDLDAADFRE